MIVTKLPSFDHGQSHDILQRLERLEAASDQNPGGVGLQGDWWRREDLVGGGADGSLSDTLFNIAIPTGSMGGWSPGSTAVEGSWGLFRAMTATGTNSITYDDLNIKVDICTTAAGAAGSDAGFQTNSGWTRRGISYPIFVTLVCLNPVSPGGGITDIVTFTGLTNAGTIDTMMADNPAGDYIGLQVSTPRGDTNFQITHKDNVTQTVVNTGVPLDVNPHIFTLDFETAGLVRANLYNFAGVLQFSTPLTLTLPRTTQALNFLHGIETQSATAKTYGCYYAYGLNRFLV